MADTKVKSALIGRLSASIASFVAFACVAFGLSADETEAVKGLASSAELWVAGGLSLWSTATALFSKLREKV